MGTDADLIETLVNLGYRREDAKTALRNAPAEISGIEERLRAALRALTGNHGRAS
jgi:Holliday junction resolvasome RuvABC DNA-binding subunit